MAERTGLQYIECGNTTYKLATPRGGEEWEVERFRTTSKLIARLDPSIPAVIAPVAEERGVRLVEDLSQVAIPARIIKRSDLYRFLNGSYATPETIGLDRVLNLVGVRGDGVVVSCGTCITVDMVINQIPSFGAILPGYTTSSKGLTTAVPVLPPPRLNSTPILPATTSEESVSNGVLLSTTYGTLAVAAFLLHASSPAARNVPLILTGGAAGLMVNILSLHGFGAYPWSAESVHIVPDLLFQGMASIEK